MYDFFHYMLYELWNSMRLVIPAGLLAAAVLGTSYALWRKKHGKERKFPWKKVMLSLLLAGYLLVVLSVTLLRWSGGYQTANLHLFRAWREAWNDYSFKGWANVLLNVAMFAPMGFLVPLLSPKLRKWYTVIPMGFCFSLAIELLQLMGGRGLFDVDDLFCNTLGAAMGFFLVMLFLPFGKRENRAKTACTYAALFLLPVLSICAIFVVYALKPYGNLPEAAAYSCNLGSLDWSLQCQLPESGGQASVYRNQTRSLDDCDAFAADFAETVGTVFDDIIYYEEAAYYLNHGSENGHHFLFLNYHDTGYQYETGGLSDPSWVEASREEVENALETYPLGIPSYAEFTQEGEGWHSFCVEQHLDGATLVDGVLRCRYSGDGTIRSIENGLLSYTFHATEPIISADEAYRQLQKGAFSEAERLRNADAVTVAACSLDYAIDTKGFYQPVYTFCLVTPENGYEYTVMIPALQ